MIPCYYALGMKGWVEIRKSTRPPKLHVSSRKKLIDGEKFCYVNEVNPFNGQPFRQMILKKCKVPLEIKAISYTNGKSLGMWETGTFARITKIKGIKEGDIIHVPDELIPKLLKKLSQPC